MKLPIYQVDAFTAEIFSGNPAAVCLLDSWLDEKMMQAIAAENNLSETAFIVPDRQKNGFGIRWFTPMIEVALCGHATLASALVLFECRGIEGEEIVFHTRNSGQLIVTRAGNRYELDFPARKTDPYTTPGGLCEALGIGEAHVFVAGEDLMVVVEDEEVVRTASPDFSKLTRFECRGVILTATGRQSDFVSRFFAPRAGINEDPVTGSAHCALIPYWSAVLGKQTLRALQISTRGGELFCLNRGDRVTIGGRAALYMAGEIRI